LPQAHKNKSIIPILISVIVLVAGVAYIFSIPQPSPSYFPLWILDTNGLVPDVVENIVLNQTYSLIIMAQNKMGLPKRCMIEAKLGNKSMIISSAKGAKPFMGLPVIWTYEFNLSRNEESKITFQFKFQGNQIDADNFSIDQIEINNFSVNSINLTSTRDPELEGFVYQFVFELWLLENDSANFSGSWVSSPFLNVTSGT